MDISNPLLDLNRFINDRQWLRCTPPIDDFNHRNEMCAPWVQDERRIGVTIRVGPDFFIVMRDRRDRITDCWKVV